MSGPGSAATLRTVWIALADQFLDTETRYLVPGAALRCVEAGLGAADARQVWLHDIIPAVGGNLLCVAGEWAGWDESWLVDEIEARRRSVRASPIGRLADRIASRAARDRWTAIERCIEHLVDTPAAARRQSAADLELLARLYFDFVPASCAELSPERRQELLRSYRAAFLPIFSALVVSGGQTTSWPESKQICAARVESALAR